MRDICSDDFPPKKEVYCKCGYPDMPGSCPGWRNCPMCVEDRTCPKCHSGDYNQRFHEYDVTCPSSPPDCSWWVCEDCGYESEPE